MSWGRTQLSTIAQTIVDNQAQDKPQAYLEPAAADDALRDRRSP